MAYSYDPRGYEERSFAPVPIGRHRVRIVDAEERLSSGGNMMTEIVVRVIDDGREGSKLWEYVVHNEYADAKFGQILEACGKDPKVKREITPGLFMNLEADVQVKHETYEGQKRAKIHYWIKPEEGDAFEEERSPTEDDPLPF